MSGLYIASIATALLCAYLLYVIARRDPEQFSAKSVQASLFVLGVLALVLIAFISMIMLLLRQTY